ncbi:MAG: hypothetical protein GY950_26975 [bacterium]|nr:hypothetical protein [bacterium]
MRSKRRRIFYIDRIFQKKLLVLFLGLNVVVVIANIAFYLIYLKGAVEENLYRSHIVLSNINQLIAGDVVYFNILLAVVSLVLVVVFYSFTRLRLKSFFDKTKRMLLTRQERREEEPYTAEIPREFYEIDTVLGDFIDFTDKELAEENKRIDSLKELLA